MSNNDEQNYDESYEQYGEENYDESYEQYDEQNYDESYEQYTEEQTIDWGNRIENSLKGISIGILCFFFSFWILTWNEGHADLANVAKTIVQISSSFPISTHIGKLVSTTGIITSNELLGDNLFLKPGKYIAVARAVEMYAWVEKTDTESKKHIGGAETQIKTVTYTKQWVDSEWLDSEFMSGLINDTSIVESTKSNSFQYPENHQNPPLSIKNAAYKVSAAKVGVYNLDMASIQLPFSGNVSEAFDSNVMAGYEGLPTPTPITPTAQNTILTKGVRRVGNYLYKGTRSLEHPRLVIYVSDTLP